MKCPTCEREGYTKPPRGAPIKIDAAKVKKLRAKGKSLRDIAAEMGVSFSAIRYVLKREGIKSVVFILAFSAVVQSCGRVNAGNIATAREISSPVLGYRCFSSEDGAGNSVGGNCAKE